MQQTDMDDRRGWRTTGWRLAADTAGCLRFFSRLPVTRFGPLDQPATAPDFVHMARAMPVAGALLALGPALVWLLLQGTGLPPLASAGLVVALQIAMTGALHEDGLGDVADGFFGGATRERRLEIMKDSRIGAFAAITLALTLLLRISLLAALPERFGTAGSLLLLIGSEAVSRALCLWQWRLLPSARPDGLAARFGIPSSPALREGATLSVFLLLPAIFTVPFGDVLLGLLLAVLCAYATGRLAFSKIGGMTGDVLGAVQQISSIGFLVGLLVLS